MKTIDKTYDVLIIGGGINGAAIANMTAGHGLKVALVEKGDFAGGTSSKSTKLIHGGLRYLENFEFDLVREALKERFIQLKSAPHLVKPLPFVVPVYRKDRRPLWLMKLGVALYDRLAGRYAIERHRPLTARDIKGLIPEIKEEGLRGGILYYDAQMDDARLCLENVLNAKAKGADVFNYVKAKSFFIESGKVAGARLSDMLGDGTSTIDIRAKKTVCAVGPWTNELLRLDHTSERRKMRLTKGVHIVYRKKFSDHAVLLQTSRDRRFFFVIPWMNHSLIGTTDTDYTGDADRVAVSEQDIEYLLQETRRVFPQVSFSSEDIITTFAGLRPLVYQRGRPSRVSRKHLIAETFNGVIYIVGGKYTTYRKIAEECCRKLLKEISFSDSEYRLYGSGNIQGGTGEMAQKYGIDEDVVDYLKTKYGSRFRDVLELTKANPASKKKICTCSPAIHAQIEYSREVELARTPDDIIWRRLGLGYLDCPTHHCRKVIEGSFKHR